MQHGYRRPVEEPVSPPAAGEVGRVAAQGAAVVEAYDAVTAAMNQHRAATMLRATREEDNAVKQDEEEEAAYDEVTAAAMNQHRAATVGPASIEQREKEDTDTGPDLGTDRLIRKTDEDTRERAGENEQEEPSTVDFSKFSPPELKQYMAKLFQIGDMDGSLDRDELKSLLGWSGFRNQLGWVDEVLDRFDKNGDGVIDYDEFAAMMTEFYQGDKGEPQDSAVSASVQRHVTALRDRERVEKRVNPSMPAWEASSASEEASQGKMSSRPRRSSKQAISALSQAANEIRTRDTTIAALREEINTMKQNHQQTQAEHASAQDEWHQGEIQTKSELVTTSKELQETYKELAKQKESLDTTIKEKMDLEEASQFYQARVNRVEDERDCLEAALHQAEALNIDDAMLRRQIDELTRAGAARQIQITQQDERIASSSSALIRTQQEKSVLEVSLQEKVLGWQEATAEFAVAEAERDNLREELDAAKLEIKRLQDACDHLALEVNGLVLGWLLAVCDWDTFSHWGGGRGERCTVSKLLVNCAV